MEYIHKAKAEQSRAKLLAYQNFLTLVNNQKLTDKRTRLLVNEGPSELLKRRKHFLEMLQRLLQSRLSKRKLLKLLLQRLLLLLL